MRSEAHPGRIVEGFALRLSLGDGHGRESMGERGGSRAGEKLRRGSQSGSVHPPPPGSLQVAT